MQFLIFALIYFAEFITSPKSLLFYDQIEYLKIVSTHSFWQVLPLGHFPIHPFFQSIFWITSRLTIPNYTAFLFSIASGVLMYKISKIIFGKHKYFWLPAIIFLLFPGVWLVNTNLMIQSVLLTFYLGAVYFFLKRKTFAYSLLIFILVGIDIDAIYWIPTIFLFPFLFKKEISFNKKELIKFLKLGIFSTIVSCLFYAFIYIFIRKDFGGSTEQLSSLISSGILRNIRNIWIGFINNFGSITPFILLYMLFRKIKLKSEWIAWGLFVAFFSIGGAYWAGDLMMRRMVFAGVVISLALYKYFGNKSLLILIFLLPITGLNAALYYRNTAPALSMIQQKVDSLPKNQVLISSQYYSPFISYEGSVLLLEAGASENMDNYLEEGKRVFITKETVTSPYLLLVGNNYHITSLSKAGNSDARILFEKYKVDLYEDLFEIKSFSAPVSEYAGEPVIFYGRNFWERLSRRRINYGDIGIWIWSFISGHKDALGWTYKDATGAWVYNEIGI